MTPTFSIAVHGGAGTILPEQLTPTVELEYKSALAKAVEAGRELLRAGADALEAVSAAVVVLEDFHLFNAGRGSVFTAAGTHEMDACVAHGLKGETGAVAGVSGVINPVLLAADVMRHTPHVLLVGDGALAFARERSAPMAGADYFRSEQRFQQWQLARSEGSTVLDHHQFGDKKFGTVGAVALDQHGNLAAATSTGGMTNKRVGRVGDTPIFGAGTFADNRTCAVSCTGSGEFFIRKMAASRVAALMELKGMSLNDAAMHVIHTELPAIGGDGGLIAINAAGEMVMPFNTAGMYRAWAIGQQAVEALIF